MGLESFRVELRGGARTHRETAKAIGNLDHVTVDHDSIPTPGSLFFVKNDGEHVIEIELMDSPIKISCRFTLCHPPSVDSVFLRLVQELMTMLGMEARICDDVRPEYAHAFPLCDFELFSAIA